VNVRTENSASADVRMEVGRRIRERRGALDLSQSQLGKLLRSANNKPVAVAQVSRWERGANLPGRRYWTQLADVLQMPLDGLVGELIPSEGGDLMLNRIEALEARLETLIRLQGLEDAVDAALRAQAIAKRHLGPTAQAAGGEPVPHSPEGQVDEDDQGADVGAVGSG
jgi:transcriptional regulator with XRE-family HTH domain